MALVIYNATDTGFVDFAVDGETDRRTAHLAGLRRTKAQFADLRPPFTDLDESDVDALIRAIEDAQDRRAEKLADHRIDASMGWQ